MSEILLERVKATTLGCEGCHFDVRTKDWGCCGANEAFRSESVCSVVSNVETYIWRVVSD